MNIGTVGGTTAQDPAIDTEGVHITHDTYLEVSGDWDNSANCGTFFVWIKYVQGTLGTFAEIGYNVGFLQIVLT